PFAGERDYVTDVLTGIIVASVLLLLVILLYIRIYQRDQQWLKRLDNLRQEFLGNVSHELKTPLTSVSGYAQACQIILGMGIPDAANWERLKISADFMISESDRMIRLVEQLLDVTAAEHGGIRLQRAALSLADADRERILQVFVNLLSNAMRHTRNGAITLSARQEGHMLRVALSDTGEGIPDDIKPALFERYLNAGVGRAAGRGTTAVFTLPVWRA
ncbi:MAG: HAMP domain-containing histidine kinase, partial [Peptococcaceae bacterium]|nr:HAMP domain-containing histidine kinase [Peptococcaceae bacterium]